MKLLALIFFSLCIGQARAQDEPVRLDLRLMAADLVDEMVYTWLQHPGSVGPANLVVAEIDGPVGISPQFEQDIENHLYEVLRANPKLSLQLVHCALCRQWVTVSNPKRTVLGRALAMPEGQEQLAKMPHGQALSLHFDVLADDLVLWAEIYEVAPPQKVVWSQRYAHATSARSVLREPTRLISISEAREEQRQLMAGHETLQAVTRFPIRMFSANKAGAQGAAVEIPPLIFLEQSFEAALSPKRNRRAGISAGVTSLKGSMQGWSLGAAFEQLLWRNEPSLTEPDLYLRAGINYLRLEGPGAAVFAQNQIDINRLINSTDTPRASLTTFHLGLEAHIKYRFGLSAFVEYIPALNSSQTIETQHLLIPFHSVGVSGVFLW